MSPLTPVWLKGSYVHIEKGVDIAITGVVLSLDIVNFPLRDYNSLCFS